MKNAVTNTVRLLWTGGYDSTFQLLRLLIIHKFRVIPYYIIDEERNSTGIEIRTMKTIKSRLAQEYPYTQELLEPTQFFAVSDILKDKGITDAFQTIRIEKPVGAQYDWLARFCKENGIRNMQLGLVRNGNMDVVLEHYISKYDINSQIEYRIDSRYKDSSEYLLFEYFSFPIINFNKQEIFEIAKKNDWEDILNMTWFCHNPTKKMKPCGRCKPCMFALKEGFGWRMPLRSRIVSVFYRNIARPFKSMIINLLFQRRLKK